MCPIHPPPDPANLPHAITFFTTARERSAILKALRRLAPDRRTALCKSLGIRCDQANRPETPASRKQPASAKE